MKTKKIEIEITRNQHDELRKIDSDYSKAVAKLVRRYSKDVPSNKHKTFMEFLSDRIIISRDYYDTVPLKEAYESYLQYVSLHHEEGLSKQYFRACMEDIDIPYGHGGGNIAIFRNVKLTNEDSDFDDTWDDDEEWEL